jgi:ApbE superfamily uncharacterized protein (UPF0280 family)
MISSQSEGLHKLKYQLRESRCTVITDRPEALNAAVSGIKGHRAELEEYIQRDPVFQLALDPIDVVDGPEVAMLMAEASRRAGVGPMAAVAGVLADLAVREMLGAGARVAVVENGGEACFHSDRPMDIAIQAGETPLSRRVGFRLEEFPVGVATSSGLFSHALSFGEAEAATVFAENAGVADAAATAVANVVKGYDEKAVVEEAVDLGLSIEGVRGVFIIYRGHVGLGGEVPTIISVNPDEEVIVKEA